MPTRQGYQPLGLAASRRPQLDPAPPPPRRPGWGSHSATAAWEQSRQRTKGLAGTEIVLLRRKRWGSGPSPGTAVLAPRALLTAAGTSPAWGQSLTATPPSGARRDRSSCRRYSESVPSMAEDRAGSHAAAGLAAGTSGHLRRTQGRAGGSPDLWAAHGGLRACSACEGVFAGPHVHLPPRASSGMCGRSHHLPALTAPPAQGGWTHVPARGAPCDTGWS